MPGDNQTRGRWSLFGPVLAYDLVREGRRSRGLLLRCGYALLLLGVLFWLYADKFGLRPDWNDLLAGRVTGPGGLSAFAEQFFNTFLVVQYCVVLVLTPAYAAGAVAEEKERRTLDDLLATDLTSREIVCGKLASRLSRMLVLLLTGVPILALTPLWGGVDPQLVVTGFAATAVTMLSVACLSLLNSVHAKRPIDAVLRTYFQVGLFLLFGSCIPGPNLGHPVFAVTLLSDSFFGRGALSGAGGMSLAVVFGGYTLVHLLIAGVCLTAAVFGLRPTVHRVGGKGGRRARPSRPPVPPPSLVPFVRRRLPLVGDNPLLWKEMYLDQYFIWERVHPALAMMLVFLGVCAGSIGVTVVLVPLGSSVSWIPAINAWARTVGTAVAVALWLVQGFYGASAVSRERERRTLDNILTLPESRGTILFDKWLGNVLSTRQAWWCLGAVWGWGMVTGGLHVLAVPMVILAWAILSGFVASLSLYCSVRSRTSLRGILWTFVAVLIWLGVTWLVAESADNLAVVLPASWGEPWRLFAENGLPLPMPLISLAFPYDGTWFGIGTATAGSLLGGLAGLLFYAGATWLLWRGALAAFRRSG